MFLSKRALIYAPFKGLETMHDPSDTSRPSNFAEPQAADSITLKTTADLASAERVQLGKYSQPHDEPAVLEKTTVAVPPSKKVDVAAIQDLNFWLRFPNNLTPNEIVAMQATIVGGIVCAMIGGILHSLGSATVMPAVRGVVFGAFDQQKYFDPTQRLQIFGLNLDKAGNMDQVLAILPFALIICLILLVVVSYLSRESKSREIEWTDTHLMLEHSGPLSIAVKWSAIESVTQTSRWDIFSGHQPVFVLKTHEGHEFRLKMGDISRKQNIGTFFSLIKTNAPKAELNVDQNFASNNSYTELWLKYFSTPAARAKTESLQAKMLLDDGRYEVLDTIGGGGQGTAFLAQVKEQPKNSFERTVKHIMEPEALEVGEQIVLKEYVLPVHRGQLTAERTAEKLKAEAEILKSLQHPQIVQLKDAFIEDFRGYLVLEYVLGESLKTLVERLGPQPEELVIVWALSVCDILSYMHGLSPSVVHRDITPDNLMLQSDNSIKLVDFNVAYQVDSSSTATVVGKHAYIAAEQFRGKPVPQSDIYSLGGSMHFLLTGKDPEPITRSHPRALNPQVTERLDEIVAKCTTSSLKDRYATIEDLADDLLRLVDRR